MTRPRKLLAPGLTALTLFITTWLACAQNEVLTLTNLAMRVMGANLTTGNYQRYETPGTNILVGLKPDVVAIQEFKFLSPTGLGTGTPAALREMVDLCFGTNFSYYREPYEASGDLPNGIISRWPIVASGSWPSPQVSNRGFAWAQIRPPGTNDLYVVSVHLHTATASSRAIEAGVIKSNRLRFFPANAWVIVAGDFNTDNRSEAAVSTFKTFLSDQPIPTDQNSNANTSAPRSKPYDYVLSSFSFTNFLVPVVIGSRTFSSGLVFDSRVYTPIAEVAPVTVADSGASNMQHMGVVKDFRLRWAVTNYRPAIITQPLPQTVPPGGTAMFSVGATGTPPLSYQWRRDDTILAGATRSACSLTNVQAAEQGNYTVVITNGFGSVTSAPAALVIFGGSFVPTNAGIGSAIISNGCYVVSGSGEDIEGTEDRFFFVYTSLQGDGQIIAQLSSLVPDNPLSEAGVMMRDGFAGGDRHVFLTRNAANKTIFRRRSVANYWSVENGVHGTNSLWMRLMRMGDTFTGHSSTNGVNWNLVWWTTVTNLPMILQAGLAVTSHRHMGLATATFCNVTVGKLTPLSGAWPEAGPRIWLAGEPYACPPMAQFGGFKMLIGSAVGDRLKIKYSANADAFAAAWLTVGTVTNHWGVVDFLDHQALTNRLRFYRVQTVEP